MTYLQGISLKEALKQAKDMGVYIDHKQINAQRSGTAADPKRQAAIEKVIQILLEKAPRHELYGMKYLTQERGLLSVTLARAADRGILRFLPGGINWQANRKWLADTCGRKLLEEAGIWKADKKAPALAFRPILTFLPHGKSFEARVIESKPGTPKSIRFGTAPYPYWLPAHIHGANRVYIVEGIIDGLSVNQMFPAVNVIAIPGSTSWKPEWLGRIKAFFSKRGSDAEIIIATDNDEAGEKAAEKIAHFCQGASISYSRAVPDNGYNDWNEMLVNLDKDKEAAYI